ncbi:MAG: hypothetical protein O3A00_24255 [Planctomycetota bacterium]|nr:hypothetical protein [Planctomycetota bacterium]
MFATTYDDGQPPTRPFATSHPTRLVNRKGGINPNAVRLVNEPVGTFPHPSSLTND